MHLLVVVLITRCKACQYATSYATDPTWNGLVSNLGGRGLRPVSNRQRKHLFFKHVIDLFVLTA
jgi:hypothetical protein